MKKIITLFVVMLSLQVFAMNTLDEWGVLAVTSDADVVHGKITVSALPTGIEITVKCNLIAATSTMPTEDIDKLIAGLSKVARWEKQCVTQHLNVAHKMIYTIDHPGVLATSGLVFAFSATDDGKLCRTMLAVVDDDNQGFHRGALLTTEDVQRLIEALKKGREAIAKEKAAVRNADLLK